MELRTLIDFYKTRKLALFLGTIAGTSLGALLYFLPFSFSSTGSFYIKRAAEPGARLYFTYDGYYSQQTALTYTNTVIALLESDDLRKKALEKMGVPITTESLNSFEHKIGVTKAGPQLITLTTKGGSTKDARDLWIALSTVLTETTDYINKTGDPALSVSKVADEPVLKRNFSSALADIGGGSLFGLGFTTSVLALGKYLTTSKPETGRKRKVQTV